MSKTLFINYRRDDSSPVARGLRENLIEAFGDAVFMDVDEISLALMTTPTGLLIGLCVSLGAGKY